MASDDEREKLNDEVNAMRTKLKNVSEKILNYKQDDSDFPFSAETKIIREDVDCLWDRISKEFPSNSLADRVVRGRIAECYLLVSKICIIIALKSYEYFDGINAMAEMEAEESADILNYIYNNNLVLSYSIAESFYQHRDKIREFEAEMGETLLIPVAMHKSKQKAYSLIIGIVGFIVAFLFKGIITSLIAGVCVFFISKSVFASLKSAKF